MKIEIGETDIADIYEGTLDLIDKSVGVSDYSKLDDDEITKLGDIYRDVFKRMVKLCNKEFLH